MTGKGSILLAHFVAFGVQLNDHLFRFYVMTKVWTLNVVNNVKPEV